MVKREYIILWALGIHARPSSTLAKCMEPFNLAKADIAYKAMDGTVHRGSMKSVMELLFVCAPCQGTVEVVLDGPDEEKAAAFLQEFFGTADEEELYQKYNPALAQQIPKMKG